MFTSDRTAGSDREPNRARPASGDPAHLDGPAPVSPWLGGQEVTLGVPATSDSLRLVRLLASGMASATGMDIESVEDVRIAVDELANAALSAARSGSVLSLTFVVADELRVDGRVPCAPGAPVELEPLAAQIVRAVASSHTIGVADGEVRFVVTFASPPGGRAARS